MFTFSGRWANRARTRNGGLRDEAANSHSRPSAGIGRRQLSYHHAKLEAADPSGRAVPRYSQMPDVIALIGADLVG